MENVQTQLEKLNQFTRRTHTAEEVFLFDVRLCDNEIDRDGERFSLEALSQLQKLFIGRTGIFDHNPRGENQTARLYDTELVQMPERTTAAGECYTYLKGHAYMIRTEANQDLIREIDGGIKKEVSISCAAGAHVCSICGADRRTQPCVHYNGQTYGGTTCHTILSDIRDAYEWSFVAIPAQREAGVTKRYAGDGDRCAQLEQALAEKSALLQQAETAVRQDIVRLRFLTEGALEQDAVDAATERMNLEELLQFQETLRTRQKKQCTPQLPMEKRLEENTAFCMTQRR